MRHFSFADNGHLVVWLGPRLLYTVSQNGFKLSIFTNTILKIAGKNRQFIISLGEIDCRVHFVPKLLSRGSLEFDRLVSNYKNAVLNFLELYGGSRALVLTPVPPSDFGVINPQFPRNGLITERVQAYRLITDSLVAASSGKFFVVNISQVLSDEIGVIDPRYSSDGVHVNKLGAKRVLQELGF
jgi:lysophospholipase L1-like esterase